MNHLISSTAAAALLLVCQCASAAPATRPSQDFTVGASVDGEGSITQIQNPPDMPPAIVALLQEALPHWHFQPVLRDGKPALVHTFLRARVQAIPTTGGKFQVRIAYAGVGPMAVPGTPPPAYAADAIRRHEEAFVLVSYDLRPDGSHVVASVNAVGESRNDPLARAVREWVAQTRDTPETVNGQPVAAHLTTYVTFSLTDVGMMPAGMKPSLSGSPAVPPLDATEKKLLAAAGYTNDGDLLTIPASESVLKPASTQTVILNP